MLSRLPRFTATLIALAVVAPLAMPATAQTFEIYTVGNGPDCPYTNIQDAVDAAAAHPGTDLVWIVNDHTYSGQQVVVTDQDVDIEGGFSDCDDFDPQNDFSTVSGSGNAGGAVFTIRGTSHVFFANLSITGANRDGDASGGGIDFDGIGSVALRQTGVSQNSAGYGAGINMKGDGGAATLTLMYDSTILSNTASTSGGGIRIEGDTRLYVLEPSTLIAFNHAPGGYGGGIEVLGPARADIGSPGYLGGAVLQFNDAQYGGGVAAIAINDFEDPVVRVFTVDPANPVQIANNSASATGGAVYLKPRITEPPDYNRTNAILCAYDFRIDDNLAQEGAAIYADEDATLGGLVYSGSDVALNTNPFLPFHNGAGYPCVDPEPPSALGATACAEDIPCNEINDNIAEDVSGQPTPGSAILVQTNGQMFADRFSLRGNEGAHVLRFVESANSELRDCLFAENTTGEVVYGVVSGQLLIDSCTLAGNLIGSTAVIHDEGNFLEVTHSIIDQPGVLALEFVGNQADLTLQYLLANDTSTFSGLDLISGSPTFVDPASGDFHLQPTSLGVDYAPAAGGYDLDRRSRDIDLPNEPNSFGPRDLGAYEIQLACSSSDTIFCDGFDD